MDGVLVGCIYGDVVSMVSIEDVWLVEVFKSVFEMVIYGWCGVNGVIFINIW